MLHSGMLDMSRKERIAVDTLLEKLGEPKAGISRRDPGESGPLLIKSGGKRWEIDADGTTTEVTDG
jgi:hypothetical protein